ncbi:mitochondrial intermembrane space import and assembly protein 40-like [Acanthaster planci]|uniref:Mitochondrial intermembrane space import and assembly protein 40-like n=1 Tax=Acanthaster planci TaxID=133434 RepID=A0A8B7YXK6_ACAPL|nr:mitochondrial intermembrane space import and assembly protein 40-like [Acanthaster planci]
MSYCRQEGKDRVIFLTKEDQDEPIQTKSVKDLVNEEDDEEGEGLILPNGDINWNCPCLGGMASGPCGVEFREAFSCFHYSEADPKGSDCIDSFRTMQECMVQYPELYPVGEDKEREMVKEAEEAGQDTAEDGVHHISESKEVAAPSDLDRDSNANVTSAVLNNEDVVVQATTGASSEGSQDAVYVKGESKS